VELGDVASTVRRPLAVATRRSAGCVNSNEFHALIDGPMTERTGGAHKNRPRRKVPSRPDRIHLRSGALHDGARAL